LLSSADYAAQSDSAFAWNEFELQSKEYADADDVRNIALFWGAHLPFLMSVKNGYAYVAIGIGDHNSGKVFYGSEPEYEQTLLIAETFSEFKESYINAINGDASFEAYKFII